MIGMFIAYLVGLITIPLLVLLYALKRTADAAWALTKARLPGKTFRQRLGTFLGLWRSEMLRAAERGRLPL